MAGAISPVMLTEQALLLAGRDGRRTGTLFAAGAVATLLVLVVLMVILGCAFRLPTEPRLSHSLDLVVGAVLIARALMVPAAKVVSSANVDLAGRALLVSVIIVIASLPAWAPVALTITAPDAGQRALTAISLLIVRWGRLVLVMASAAAGGFFVIRGATKLLG